MCPNHYLVLAIFCLLVPLLANCQKFISRPHCFISKPPRVFGGRYVQDGDIMIGGIFAVNYFYEILEKNGNRFSFCNLPLPSYYRYMMAFIFTIDEINRNPNLLPNITLGYHVTDSCNNINNAVDQTLQILTGPATTVPNYRCGDHNKLVGIIGNQFTKTSLCIIEMINLYGHAQISFGAADSLFSNKQLYPNFFQTLPGDQTQTLAIVKLLKHFGWTWICIIASDDESGEKQTQELRKVTEVHDICIEFVIMMEPDDEIKIEFTLEKRKMSFTGSTSQVVVFCGTVSFSTMHFLEVECGGGRDKTLIVPASTGAHVILSAKLKSSLHGSLVFSPPTRRIPLLKAFLHDISLEMRPNDTLVEQILASYYKCSTSHPLLNGLLEFYYQIKLHKCERIIQLGELGRQVYNTHTFGTTYQVYKAVYAVAHALHEMQLYFYKNGNGRYGKNATQLHKFLRRVRFQDPLGENVYFNERGEMDTMYHIHNYVLVIGKYIDFKQIGSFNVSAHEREQLTIHEGDILWKRGEIPISRCSPDCPSGYRRVFRRGKHKCCFTCAQCSDGEISNHPDNGLCQKCPEDQWPNDKNQCVLKRIDYLSYRNDPIVLTISIISAFCFVKTLVILVLFFLYRDTPVIKAQNRNLSYIILVSIMLGFLSVFLFLGHPVHLTCLLCHVLFLIIFSIAISCILAKTLMVYVAFKATKPGSLWKHVIGLKTTNGVVFIFSLIPILVSIIWLSVKPPYPEYNSHIYHDKVILLCNVGSVLTFSILLGYMGLLASVSFIIAFLARNLPDSFNEAKNITFSMLVVCSVWVAFIPAYMGVTGKNAILVEIFAILSSNLGILVCIFIPKCYIVLMRPELNSRNYLLKQSH